MRVFARRPSIVAKPSVSRDLPMTKLFKGALAALVLLFVSAPSYAQMDPVARGLAASKVAASPTNVANNTQWHLYGDSLPCGEQSVTDGATTLGTTLQSLLGVPYIPNPYNHNNPECIGGQDLRQVLERAGIQAIPLTLQNSQLVTGPNTVTAFNGVSIHGMNAMGTPEYQPLSTPQGATTYTMTGWQYCGSTPTRAVMTRTANASIPSTTESYTVTPIILNQGIIQQATITTLSCPANSAFVPDSAGTLIQPTIIWATTNNSGSTAEVNDAEIGVSAFVSKMQSLNNTRYKFIGPLSSEGNTTGSGNGANVITIENYIAVNVPAGHYFNPRSYLLSLANASNIMDQADVANGVQPSSLRAITSEGTLSASLGTTGCPAVTVTLGTAAAGLYYINDANPEYIGVPSVSSGQPSGSCVRGQGNGGTAYSHSSGAAFEVIDNTHLLGATDATLGTNIATNDGAMLTAGQNFVTPGVLYNAFAMPPFIGSVDQNPGAFSYLWVTNNGSLCFPYSNGGNVIASACMYGTGNGSLALNIPSLLPNSDGSATLGSSATHWSYLFLKGVTVATLPTCSSTNKGEQGWVSDASSPTFLGTLTGGSTTATPVFCNGSAWVAY
jgi:hypothetical protein